MGGGTCRVVIVCNVCAVHAGIEKLGGISVACSSGLHYVENSYRQNSKSTLTDVFDLSKAKFHAEKPRKLYTKTEAPNS